MEEYAYVLDYLSQGRTDPTNPRRPMRREPIVLGVGEDQFKLFELLPLKDVTLSIGDRVYIGKDISMRDKIHSVRCRIGYHKLTNTAAAELPFILEDIVKSQEERFVDFINKAHPINTRYHMLELFPGMGKKMMWAVVNEMKTNGSYKSLKEMEDRIQILHHPERIIARRIEYEIKERNLKYRLFVAR
ncbi:MAG: DUF655 domain-containing protein [Thermoplasmata archaeon]|nr:DUF655 domain-containing protein [Thermoplasmata archaeon]